VTLGSPTFCGATVVAADDVAAQAVNTPPTTATAAATPSRARYMRSSALFLFEFMVHLLPVLPPRKRVPISASH
jgi:hypothetical protein